jgi:hypothetical protein
MAAAARNAGAEGVLIPPGTSVVVLSFDGPVDVPALHYALGQMIAERDLLGLPVEALDPAPPLATGGPVAAGVYLVGEDSCALRPPADAARLILEHAHDYGQQMADTISATTPESDTDDNDEEDENEEDDPFDDEEEEDGEQADEGLDAFAIAPPAPGPAPVATAPADDTPLGHLRLLGHASAAQLAASLGVTPQKAAKDLAELVRDGRAVKDGRTYSATPHASSLTPPSPTA